MKTLADFPVINNDKVKETLFIAKQNTMYTLWKVKVYMEDIYEVTSYIPLGSISKTYESVQKRFPGLEFKEDWKWRHRHDKYVNTSIDFSKCFNCGKYAQVNFMEIDDPSYLKWAWTTDLVTDENRDYFIQALSKNKLVVINNKVESLDEIKETNQKTEKRNMFLDFSKEQGSLKIKFNKNLNFEGEYYSKEFDLTISFPDYKSNTYYQGWNAPSIYYTLPVKDGKAKRVKGKIVNITKYHIDENNKKLIHVEDFEIFK